MKEKLMYVCSNCGYESPKWFGKCPICSEWNTAIEKKSVIEELKSNPVEFKEINEIKLNGFKRLRTNISEFDRLIGGGIVPGSVILVGGDPGVGKSTLMLEISRNLSKVGEVFYITGEESEEQILIRANRIGMKENENLKVTSSSDLKSIFQALKSEKPIAVIIDSIQSMRLSNIGLPGSVVQLRDCAEALVDYSKSTGVPVFIVGHITKTGQIAGPKLLEHLVDVVLYFEGEVQTGYRILRTVKNRFGPSNEIAIFEMRNNGLQEVKNPSEIFIERGSLSSGSCITSAIEGTRTIFLEIQSLISKTFFPSPRRLSKGIEIGRVILISAVLSRRLNLPLESFDIYVNVVGGLNVKDPSIDLGIAVAIYSSFADVELDSDCVYIGEIGLDGKMRKVSNIEKRLMEAHKMGFKRVVMPHDRNVKNFKDLELLQYNSLLEVLKNID
ncbi:MAG TPA: DNA repair protein RadA [Thermotogaceae bacterium]|nr:DNA repair protein RadA [Thermotogaceae bacterium]